jgi:hypothetical protein
MAVKLPPDTWVSQVITLKGFRDDVYSKIDGSLVGYVKDGKFIQTIDKLPKLDPKKKPVQDKQFAASIKKISALNAIPSMEQDAAYYKEQAESVNNTPEERATAKAQFDALNIQIEAKRQEAGTAGEVVEEEQGKKTAASAKGRLPEIQSEFAKLKEQYDILLDPFDDAGKGPTIKKKLDALAQEYSQTYPRATGTPVISKTVAFARLAGNQVPQATAVQTQATGGPTGTPVQTPTPVPAQTLTPTPVTTTKPKVTTGGTTGGATGGATGGSTSGVASIPGTGQAVPSTFNVGTFRAADEASMAKAEGITPGSVVKTYDAALAEVQEKYNLPDILFSKIESLGSLLDRYVNPKKYGKDGISDIKKFTDLVKVDPWYRANEGVIRKRYIEKYNYEDLVKSGKAVGNTVYEQDIRKITDKLVKQARELGSAIDETQARLIAEDLYIHNQDAEETTVTRRLVSGIRPMAGMIAGKITEDYSGLALQNYQGLQKLAKRNGLKLEGILPPNADGTPARAEDTLKRLALGEIDPTRLAQDVRKLAAVGQPQFVRDLLGQGIDLDEIYSPYRRTMANILELNEGQIDLLDPTLRMGINDKGDVNLYDYSKMLRQDSRWQYTGNARKDVADSALTVLRNFGFQG